MRFSKTYAQILLGLPPEFRENAVQYRQLKKIIHQIVSELDAIGLNPEVLRQVLREDLTSKDPAYIPGSSSSPHTPSFAQSEISSPPAVTSDTIASGALGGTEKDETNSDSNPGLTKGQVQRVVYEIDAELGKIEPHLRIWMEGPAPPIIDSPPLQLFAHVREMNETEYNDPEASHPTEVDQVLWNLQSPASGQPNVTSNCSDETADNNDANFRIPFSEFDAPGTQDGLFDVRSAVTPATPSSRGTPTPAAKEVVVKLAADSIFFQMLCAAIEGFSAQMVAVPSQFTRKLEELARAISETARPASTVVSPLNPWSYVKVQPGKSMLAPKATSDLYSWREIFQLYVEAQVFESVNELHPGERSVEESEEKFQWFTEQIAQRGLWDASKLKMKQSREALQAFLELNKFILNLKKFQAANSEATRKILKKHAKRTALPTIYESYAAGAENGLALMPSVQRTRSLPRLLVQAIGERLLPVIPHLEDYACLICTSIAFKPIRLNCGHLFCVRCLVKMQKRRSAHCPMCRSPCVLIADKSNVDWAMLNFMKDWFPIETKEKNEANQLEAGREQLQEMGMNPDAQCLVM